MRGDERDVIEDIIRLEEQQCVFSELKICVGYLMGVMKIISWNVRGLGSDGKVAAINRLVKLHGVNVCFLRETKLEEVSGDLVRRIWGDDNFEFRFAAAVGRSGGLITIWDKSCFMLKKDFCALHLIVVGGNWCSEGWEGVLINVYAPNLLREQKIFWEEMLEAR
ncbi:hypothetical protein J1N35_028224 [Gossypium stocksii]|uniref:Endonuclease/exonuclease/phosphatase domain-containing protein n=1 Tax=Gossypium stocksii TaxID=47602 RepID=A0A9D3UVV4_9ROSI|nr:hypothetical protein J1N35_028224 [Gossypium stocksii]